MKLIEQISEATMVHEFVAAEFKSARFGPQTRKALKDLKIDPRILEKPDLTSKAENALRAEVLDICRGYNSRTLNFSNFPTRTKWFRAELDAGDFEKLQYVEDSKNWNRLSKGTRHVRDGCSYIHAMSKTSNPARFVRSIFRSIERGQKLPPIIVTTNPKHSKFVILEGACRSTAYYRAIHEQMVRKVKAVVGVSKNIGQWKLF